MTVAAVSMCYNEEDVAEYFVRHMLVECDMVLIADNASTDRTLDILRAIEDPRLFLFDEPRHAYYQAETMNRLGNLAHEMGADWVVPADFDEWWYAQRGGRIRDALDGLGADVAISDTLTLVPRPDDPPDPNPFLRPRWAEQDRGMQKVAYRPGPGRVLAMGNHHLEGAWSQVGGVIGNRHLQYRTLDQAKAKLRHGRQALLATDLDPALGGHWRALGAMFDDEFAYWWGNYTDLSRLVPAPPVLVAA